MIGRRWQTMLLALVLAVFSWYLVTGREKVEAWIKMPVEMTNPPEGMIITDGLVDTVEVRVRGPKGLVRTLTAKEIPFELNLNSLKPGENHFEVGEGALPLSNAYDIMEIRPNLITLYADRMAERRVEISPRVTGALHEDFSLGSVEVQPRTVVLKGPQSILDEIGAIPTVQVPLPDPGVEPEPFTRVVELDLPEDVEAQPGRVTIKCTFNVKTMNMWVKLQLQTSIPKGMKASTDQRYIRLHLECPVTFFRLPDFRKELSASLSVPLDLKPGKHDLDFDANLPAGCAVIESKPETVEVTVNSGPADTRQ